MCGRYGVVQSKEIFERFDAELIEYDLRDSYNVAPSQDMPVIERHSPNSVHIAAWGYTPFPKLFLINAKAEGLATSKIWKKAFETSRCIVPASWFYEWKRLDAKEKLPYLIRLKSKEMFGFAGLTFIQKDKEGKESEVYVIITTEPNSLMEKIHNRMPVILRREDEDAWLDPDTVEPSKLDKFLKPYPAELMEAYPISSLVNTPKNNFPELIHPVKESS